MSSRKGFLPYFLLKILIDSLNYDWLIDKGPVHPYPNAFVNASTRSVCESFLPVHTKTRKRYPLLIEHASRYNVFKWCIFGVWHHRIRNLHFCQSTRKRKTGVFKNLYSGERLWKDEFSVTVFSGYVWTVD